MTTGDNVPKGALRGLIFEILKFSRLTLLFIFQKQKIYLRQIFLIDFVFQKFHNGFMFENRKLVWELSRISVPIPLALQYLNLQLTSIP